MHKLQQTLLRKNINPVKLKWTNAISQLKSFRHGVFHRASNAKLIFVVRFFLPKDQSYSSCTCWSPESSWCRLSFVLARQKWSYNLQTNSLALGAATKICHADGLMKPFLTALSMRAYYPSTFRSPTGLSLCWAETGLLLPRAPPGCHIHLEQTSRSMIQIRILELPTPCLHFVQSKAQHFLHCSTSKEEEKTRQVKP